MVTCHGQEKRQAPCFMYAFSHQACFNFVGTRPCPLTYKRTCPEQVGQSTEGERSYHFETKDRGKGGESNIGPNTHKHLHTAHGMVTYFN